MDVLKELKGICCDPGPVHSPNDECMAEMGDDNPCACVVIGAAMDRIAALEAEVKSLRAMHVDMEAD